MRTYRVKVSASRFVSESGDVLDSVFESMISENGLLEDEEVDLAIIPTDLKREIVIALLHLEGYREHCEETGDILMESLLDKNMRELALLTGLKKPKSLAKKGNLIVGRS